MTSVVVRQGGPCSCPQSLVLGSWTEVHRVDCRKHLIEPDNIDHTVRADG